MLAVMQGASSYRPRSRGPFRVEHLRPGDPYELSDGHAIVAEPSGRRHGRRHLAGAALIDSDPAVEAAAVEVGFAIDEYTLRAPDVAVGGLSDDPGFAPGAPALAVEYVELGRDEADLERKAAELLGAGTQVLWVVRLGGTPRVEVRRSGQPVVVVRPGEVLEAPGILRNPVPVDALFDRTAAQEGTLRNLLQRQGYESLDAVREAGRVAGALEHARAQLRRTIALRGWTIDAACEAEIRECDELATLDGWLERAVTATTADEVFRPDVAQG